MTTTPAWLGSQEIKDLTLEMLRADQEAHRIVQRHYWEDGKGCQLGCLTRKLDGTHAAVVDRFGFPLRVAYWLEAVFEGLPQGECEQWVIDSAEAIPIGADLSLAHHRLAVWLLGPDSPSSQGNQHETVSRAVAGARALHVRAANAESVDPDEWSAARSAAMSAARSAARSAAWSAARSAARSARSAESAAESAESAAESAESAARSAESAAWKSIAKKSLDIFRSCAIIEADCTTQIAATKQHLNSILVA